LFLWLPDHDENIHSETYARIDTYIKVPRRNIAFHAIETYPPVQKRGMGLRWNQNGSFAERLVAFAAVEGIFSAGRLLLHLWMKKRGLMPGLTFAMN